MEIEEFHAKLDREYAEAIANISDGTHTFRELYAHRAALLVALMRSHPDMSWYAPVHHDGSMSDGYFIAGMNLPTGPITYHLILDPWWVELGSTGVTRLATAPKFDGHTPDDVIERLTAWTARGTTWTNSGFVVGEPALPFFVRVAAGKTAKAVIARWRAGGAPTDIDTLRAMFPPESTPAGPAANTGG